jgi:hypothetical protein
MSGVNEILIIAAIIAGIFFVPRMMPSANRQVQVSKLKIVLSGKMRLAIAMSIVYPLVVAAYFQPWKKDLLLFVYLGIGPVVLYWLVKWVFAGIKDRGG